MGNPSSTESSQCCCCQIDHFVKAGHGARLVVNGNQASVDTSLTTLEDAPGTKGQIEVAGVEGAQ